MAVSVFDEDDTSITFGQRHAARGLPKPRFVEGPDARALLMEADFRQRLDKMMLELDALADGWDGHGAGALSELTRRNARRLALLVVAYTRLPQIIPSPGDTVTFEWESDAGEALLELGHHTYSFLMSTVTGRRITDRGAFREVADIAALGERVERSLYDPLVA